MYIIVEPPGMHYDSEALLKLLQTKMPFGKYAGTPLVYLPEKYVLWFAEKGYPAGELGDLLKAVYEIKVNGLEYLFKELEKHYP